MKLNTKWFATAVAITGGVALAGSAKADILFGPVLYKISLVIKFVTACISLVSQ